MKKAHLITLAMALFIAGCGKDINGTYTGTESYSGMSGVSQGAQSGNVTLTVSGDGDDRNVNWVSTLGTGSGKLKGSDNVLTGTMTFQDQFNQYQYGQSGQAQSSTAMMNLTFGDNGDVTGTGTMLQTQQQPGQYYGGNMGGGTRTMRGKKAGES